MRKPRLVAPPLATALIDWSNNADDCHWTRICVEYGTGEATTDPGHTGGKAGIGGNAGTGSIVASGGTAPTDCTTAPPYVKALAATDIDGTPATVCSPRVSTCTALNQFSQAPCASSANTADDSLCGAAGGIDSKCVAYGACQYRSTVVCGSAADCKPGFAGNTGVNPNICDLR